MQTGFESVGYQPVDDRTVDALRKAGMAKNAVAINTYRMRKVRGWSQRELAAKLGTGQANISELESGDANPTLETLGRLASVLETSVVNLLEGIKEDREVTYQRKSLRVSREGYVRPAEFSENLGGREEGTVRHLMQDILVRIPGEKSGMKETIIANENLALSA